MFMVRINDCVDSIEGLLCKPVCSDWNLSNRLLDLALYAVSVVPFVFDMSDALYILCF